MGLIAYHCSALLSQTEGEGATEKYNRDTSVKMTTETWKERR